MIRKLFFVCFVAACFSCVYKWLVIQEKNVDYNKQVALNSQKNNKQVIRLVFPHESRVVEIDITPLDEDMLISDAVIRATI